MIENATLIIFNRREELEFAECSECGNEIEPSFDWFQTYPSNCPKCRRLFCREVNAEEYEG